MEVTDFIQHHMGIINKRLLDNIKVVNSEELLWRPNSEANSIAFILWHIFRVEDNYIQKYG